jgi:hypothetical protein
MSGPGASLGFAGMLGGMKPAAAARAHRGTRPLTWVIFFAALAVPILFCCSGLHFPMWNPAAKLNGRLSRDAGVSLPASARVTEAARVATRDPSEYYKVETPDPAAAAAFVAAVRAAAHEPEDKDPSRPWGMGPTPEWWTPQQLADVKRLDFSVPGGQAGYFVFYSESAATLYVFWYAT